MCIYIYTHIIQRMFYSNIRFEFAHKLRSLRFVFCFSSSCFRLVNNRPTISEIIRIIRIIRMNGAFSLEKDIYKILDKFCRKFGNNLNILEFDGLKWRRKKEGWVRFGPTFFFFFISREMYTRIYRSGLNGIFSRSIRVYVPYSSSF